MSSETQSCFLCVYVPEFAAQARLRHRPAMRHEALAILAGTPPLQTVCSTTRKARTQGIASGMTRAELDGYPGIVSLLRSEAEEQAAAAALLATLWTVSPRAQVLPARNGAHRLVLDIAGTERLFGTASQLAATVQQRVQSLGLLAAVAVSANFHTAVCVAPYAGTGPCVVQQGCEGEALAPLPLEALEAMTDQQRDTFTLWGLHCLGEIAALPETELVVRMGQAGRRLRMLACGTHPHLLQPESEVFALEEHTGFDTAVDVLDSLLFVLGPMLDQLVQRAAERALALASVTVQLQLTNHAAEDTAQPQAHRTYVRTVKPALPMSESRVLLKLLHLELQAHPPGAPVSAVHLSAEPGTPARAQLGMFSPQLPEPSRLDVTLARIRALVGEGRVGRPRLLDDHRPESFVVEHFSLPAGRVRRSPADQQPSGQDESKPAAIRFGSLALRRLRPAAVLHMHIAHARPQHFFWQGTRYNVDAAYGPWRHSGNWWSAAAWSQEEWEVAATAVGNARLVCRIVRDLLQQQWRLEGLYD